MVLVDTSIWVTHFRCGHDYLQELLLENQVYCHPFIVGELACGHFKNRKEILSLLKNLSQAKILYDEEVLDFIEQKKLMGMGIGYIDVHLLASAMVSDLLVWTADKRLKKVAQKLKVDFPMI